MVFVAGVSILGNDLVYIAVTRRSGGCYSPRANLEPTV